MFGDRDTLSNRTRLCNLGLVYRSLCKRSLPFSFLGFGFMIPHLACIIVQVDEAGIEAMERISIQTHQDVAGGHVSLLSTV